MSQQQVLDALYVDIDKVKTDRWDARQKPKNEKQKQQIEKRYQELLSAIRWDGITIPLLVEKDGKNFQIYDGRHRLKAAKELGIKQVPISIRLDLETEPDKIRVSGYGNYIGLDKDDIGKSRWVFSIYESAGYKVQQAMSGVKSIDNYFSRGNGCNWDSLSAEVTSAPEKQKPGFKANELRYNEEFVALCKSVPYTPKTQYQLMSIIHKLKPEVLDKAERDGLKTDKQILLTTTPLEEHPKIQKELIDKMKNTSYDNAKEIVHQTVKDLRSGYIKPSKAGSDTYIIGNKRPKEDETVLPPINTNVIDINTAIGKFLFYTTNRSITRGEHEYNTKIIKETKNYRIELVKSLDERNIINLSNNLGLLKMALDDMIKITDEALEASKTKREMISK